MASRRGFTFVEILVSMTIVALLSAVAVPKYIDLKRRASTTNIIGDIQVVRVAVLNFYADSSRFPEDADEGEIPQGLAPYLPRGFTFRGRERTLDYESVELAPAAGPNGEPWLVGVIVNCADPELSETTSRVLGNVPQIAFGNSYLFVISGM